jgi:hypothetical protein
VKNKYGSSLKEYHECKTRGAVGFSIGDRSWHIWGRDCTDYTRRYPELEVLRRLPPGAGLDGEL